MAGPLGLIAGLGDLPVRIAEAAEDRGERVYVLRVAGYTEPRLDRFPGEIVGFGEIGRQIRLLKTAGCETLVFAGVVRRPDFGKLKLDMRGARLLPKVLAAARKGDDALLRTLLGEFEKEGFRIIGAHEADTALLAETGLIAGPEPDAAARDDVHRAMQVARAIGNLDVGQGCVVCDGLVLAVEAQEGTDRMLERVATLDPAIRGTPGARRGVLAKCPKPIQDRKIDLPTIGVTTVNGAAKAGLAGIAIEGGGALILDLQGVIAAADRHGLFVFGVPPGASDQPGQG